MFDYDLLVIGSGPGGQKAAIAAAKLGKRVCLAEPRNPASARAAQAHALPVDQIEERHRHPLTPPSSVLSGFNQMLPMFARLA